MKPDRLGQSLGTRAAVSALCVLGTAWCGHGSRPAGSPAVDVPVAWATASAGASHDVLRPGHEVAQVVAHTEYTCALTRSTEVWCWGLFPSRSLGEKPLPDVFRPSRIDGLGHVVRLSAGYEHVCAVLRDGTVWCWGGAFYGRLGQGACASRGEAHPAPIAGIQSAVDVSAGGDHSCALLRSGRVVCWGGDYVGQLGDGRTGNGEQELMCSAPLEVPGLEGVAAVSAGSDHTCAVLRDGTVRCWGRNENGQLGIGVKTESERFPVTVPGLARAQSVSARSHASCVVLDDGSPWCWGLGVAGHHSWQRDPGRLSPTRVLGLQGVLTTAPGDGHSCALLRDGTVWCWGENRCGELGDGTEQTHESPVMVPGLGRAVGVATGYFHSCALLQGGTVWCWGKNNVGQTGARSLERSTGPAPVGGIGDRRAPD